MSYGKIDQIVVKNFGETAMPNYYTLYINNDFDTLNYMFQSSNSFSFTLQPHETFIGNVFSENWTSVLNDSEGNNESLFISNAINNSLTDTLISLQFPSTDTDCAQVRGSYDPNDKQGFPEGFGELNRIEKDQSINYRIRFQNTGSDTAFTVVVLDTLSEFLDYTSVIPGASSHPYTFHHEDNKLEFRFNNIDLVQKSLNEPASIGFVEFKVKQKPSTTKRNRSNFKFLDKSIMLRLSTTSIRSFRTRRRLSTKRKRRATKKRSHL